MRKAVWLLQRVTAHITPHHKKRAKAGSTNVSVSNSEASDQISRIKQAPQSQRELKFEDIPYSDFEIITKLLPVVITNLKENGQLASYRKLFVNLFVTRNFH